MTDANLRELERRFRASGSVEDEAAWLRARVQAGEISEQECRLLTLQRAWERSRNAADEAKLLAERLGAFDLQPSRLRLAACLGHSPAEVALRSQGRDVSDSEQELEELFRTVEFSAQRAALVAARFVKENAPLSEEGLSVAESILDCLEAWIACPCGEHLRAAESASEEQAATYATCLATRDDGYLAPIRSALFSAGPLESSFGWRTAFGSLSYTRLQLAMSTLSNTGDRELVRGRVRDELVPWLLGYFDPVRERVEARQQTGH